MNMRQRRLNGWRRSALMPLLLLAVLMLVLAGSLGARGTAHAQSGPTPTVTLAVASPAKLISRTTLQISGTASCTLPVGATLSGQPFGDVTVTQASGRQIVKASGGFNFATCDGTTYTFQTFATPPAGSAPFHGGSAIATGEIIVDWIDALGNFQECFCGTGTQNIRIRG